MVTPASRLVAVGAVFARECREKGDVELTRAGYELLAGIWLRPPYPLPGKSLAGDGNEQGDCPAAE